jgi:hypothetical protein
MAEGAEDVDPLQARLRVCHYRMLTQDPDHQEKLEMMSNFPAKVLNQEMKKVTGREQL